MKTRMTNSIVTILFGIAITLSIELHAANYYVTNTNDTGPGSFRETLLSCTSGFDTVFFNIPTTDPGYNPATGVWTIESKDEYTVPAGTAVIGMIIGSPLCKNSTSMPVIEFDGTDLKEAGVTGFRLQNNVTIRGLIINHFQYGIWVSAPNVTIEGCYIGTDATGSSAKPNGQNGIFLIDGATDTRIQGNLISGNESYGVRLSGTQTTRNTIIDNKIGTDITGNTALPNGYGGIYIHAGAHLNTVEMNQISGNNGIGVHFSSVQTDSNEVKNNRIGTNADGSAALANTSFGIALFNGPCDNIIGQANVIANNEESGVLVDGNNSYTGTIRNTITQNIITSNSSSGIFNFRGGNTELAPPTVGSVTNTQVTGTTGANQTVEIFFDTEDEGAFYLGTTTADASGNFTYTMTVPLPPLPNVTATTTDEYGNTSEFSEPFVTTGIEEESALNISPKFQLHQNHPNPFNGFTEISYSIPKSGHVRLAVFDMLGREVITIVNELQTAGTHSVRFDASQLTSGIYIYRMSTDGRVLSRKLLLMR
jgi:hypothetical protein